MRTTPAFLTRHSMVAVAVGILLSGAVPTASAASLGNYQSHVTNSSPAGIEITDALGNHLRLRAYGPNMIRVQAAPNGTFSPDDRYLMIENHNLGGALTVLSNTATTLLIANGDIRLSVNKTPLRLAYADAGGTPLVSDASGIDLDATTLTYNFAPDAAEKFMGYGQKRLALQDTFQLAGRTERRNYGEEGFPGRGSQGVLIVPFFMSNKGYGFFAHTTFPHEGRFNTNGEYNFRVELNGLAAPEADYFFIYGPQPAEILNRYIELTGRPRLPRKAIFGLHLSDHDPLIGFPNQNGAWWQATVSNHFNAGFPLDHMVYDNNWRADGPLPGDQTGQWGGSQFAFDPTRYPDPPAFRQWYDSKGLMLTLDLNLNICNDSYGWQTNYNINPSDTSSGGNSQPDYSNPATRAWFWDLMWTKAFNPALGYPGDAIWLDESDGIWQPDNYLIANGRPWHEMKNYYFFLTAYAAVAEGWDNVEGGPIPGIGEAKRPWVWIRGGGPGMQRYASHWTGDIEYSTNFWKGNIIGMQASGLAGFPYYNHDAGSFGSSGSTPDPDPDAKLAGPNDNYYIQWGCALGSFSPIWRPHGYGNPRWPYNRNAACQDAFRRYATLRYEMMPYIYSLAHDAHETGLPMARPLSLVYPDAPEAWQREQEYQYLWGDAFLVVPNFHLNGADEIRTAWLPPAAEWYDFWTDQPVGLGTNGGYHTFNARFGYLPIFVKAGAIIPRQNFALTTAALSDTNLIVDVYRGAAGAFRLVEDDGLSERFRTQGETRVTQLSYTEPGGLPTFNIGAASGTYSNASAARSYLVRWHGLTASPLVVTVDGAPVSIQAAPLPGGNTTVAAWDSTNRHLLVRIASRVVTATATVVVTPANTPPAPSALNAAAVSSAQINLAWTDNATNETGFKILRRTGVSGSYTQIATVGANVTTFTNTGLAAATAYYYRVCATNAAGESALGNEAGAVTFEVPPTAPSALTTTTMATNRIDLSWTDNAGNEAGFIIERKTGAGGIYSQIATIGSNVTNFMDTNGLLANTVYYYRVAATNISGLSLFSAEALGTTVLPPPPAVPTNLRAVAVSGSQISLTWTDSATNEAGFKLQRKIGAGGTYAQVATFAANTTNYSDAGLEANTAYYYRLSATNAGGDSAFSNQTNATTFAVGTVMMDGNDGFGSTSFNTALNWNNNQAPSGSNQYLTANFVLRTPAGAGGNLTFAGHSLSIDNSGSLLLKGAGGSSITVNKLRLNRGTIRNGEGGTTLTVLGDVTVQADSILDADSGGRTIVIAAPITGSAHLTVASAVGSGGIVRVTGTNDTFTGNWTNSAASTLQVGDGGIGGSLGRGRVINNGALVFNRSDAFASTNLISGSGPVTVSGSGTVTLAGTNTYTGATTVNGGTLLVNGALGNSTVFVNFSATLGGTGSISGAVSVSGGFAPGANGIGRLTISNALTLGGGATFELNKSQSPSNDLVVVTGALNAGGTLAVNNLGGALVAGDSFALFNKPVSGAFSSINFPALSVGLGWTNRLAVDGTIAVVATALPSTPATNPSPVAGAVNVALNPTLTWSPGVNATNHRVYFGSSSNAVAGATTNSPEFQGAFVAASFTPSPLASSGRFYWRVDEVGPTVVGGATWSFATLVNPAAGFTLTGSLGNDFVLSYPSQLGQTYRLERSDSLNPADWQTLSNNIPGTGGPILINDSGSNTQRFYRAVILPP